MTNFMFWMGVCVGLQIGGLSWFLRGYLEWRRCPRHGSMFADDRPVGRRGG